MDQEYCKNKEDNSSRLRYVFNNKYKNKICTTIILVNLSFSVFVYLITKRIKNIFSNILKANICVKVCIRF